MTIDLVLRILETYLPWSLVWNKNNCQLLILFFYHGQLLLNLGLNLAKYGLIFPCSCGYDCLYAKSRSSSQSKKTTSAI